MISQFSAENLNLLKYFLVFLHRLFEKRLLPYYTDYKIYIFYILSLGYKYISPARSDKKVVKIRVDVGRPENILVKITFLVIKIVNHKVRVVRKVQKDRGFMKNAPFYCYLYAIYSSLF